MNVFLDTSALFKLYHSEDFSDELEAYLEADKNGCQLIIAALAQAEFASTVWRKVNSSQSQHFKEPDAFALLQLFENDLDLYIVAEHGLQDMDSVRRLVNRCNSAGFPLRTLDAIQLQTVLKLGNAIDAFITFDKALLAAADFLGIPTHNFYAESDKKND